MKREFIDRLATQLDFEQELSKLSILIPYIMYKKSRPLFFNSSNEIGDMDIIGYTLTLMMELHQLRSDIGDLYHDEEDYFPSKEKKEVLVELVNNGWHIVEGSLIDVGGDDRKHCLDTDYVGKEWLSDADIFLKGFLENNQPVEFTCPLQVNGLPNVVFPKKIKLEGIYSVDTDELPY